MEPLGPDDPRRVGAYRLLRRLGAGGMGRVYLGRTAGGRTVAVKLVRSDLADDAEFRARFRREVAAARRFDAAWTAPVLDADTEGPRPWVATGYVAGPALDAAVRDTGPLPERSVRALGAGLAEALAAVHAAGLVHRDVKPSNVLLALDGPRLIDFGIARALDAATSLTRTGYVVGSPGYMSPEQAAGGGAGPAGDVFSLGAVLAYAATGTPPFGDGVSAAVLLYRVLHEEPDLGGLAGPLREAVAACLAKDPAARPGPEELRDALTGGGAAGPLLRDGWLPAALSAAVGRRAVALLDLEDGPQDADAAAVPPGPGADGTGAGAGGGAGAPRAGGSFGPPPQDWGPAAEGASAGPGPAPATVRAAGAGAASDAVPPPRRGRPGPGVRAAAVAGALLLAGGGVLLVLRHGGGGGGGGAAAGTATGGATAGRGTARSGDDATGGATAGGAAAGTGRPTAGYGASADPGASAAPGGGAVPAALVGSWRGDITTALVPLSSTFRVTVRAGGPGDVVTESRNDSHLTRGAYCLGRGTLLSAGPRRITVREEPSGGNTDCTATPEIQTYTLGPGGTLHVEVADQAGTRPSGDLRRQG
ncbi:serine/threonine protein kinase [Streptacidiphilus sp. ASG 303]|uniref:serine/threonine-protein kinase n=1 Tax=Streptacidiphilus sp. ASG 303 TaxID=2896847 RepID=UPI001E61FE81|nr:serine/threonine-protein kinase [Streptacidiphilus sp. ASG 303]MCD0485308.1 serine/threonine protein kinase [Streptacidiphilus sp. ASG 303]